MHRAYDVDMVTQFPNSLYRYLARPFSGLSTAHMADVTFAKYGGDKRLYRQVFGRALLNDIGVTPEGAHGKIHQRQDAINLIQKLLKKLSVWQVS